VEALGFPVEAAVCFADPAGERKERLQRHQLRLLHAAAPRLRPLLRPGEKVLLAARARSPQSRVQEWANGWTSYAVKRCLLVLTDQRMLELAVGRGLRALPSVVELQYGGIAQARVWKMIRPRLELRYGGRGMDTYWHLDPRASAQMQALLPSLAHTAPPAPGGRRHLCPRCGERLPAVERCPGCRLEFKTREQAVRYAMLVPGGGYFYARHPVMGAFHAAAEALLIALLAGALRGLVVARTLAAVPPVIVTLAVLAAAKALAVYHAEGFASEYLPVERDFAPARAA
jgi:hypothetical protein